MMFRRTSLPMLLASAGFAAAAPLPDVAALSISAPDAIYQCTPATFTWTPTTAPYFLTVIDSSSDPSFDLSSASDDEVITVRNANTATWIVDMPAGRDITVVVRDATGEIAETRSMVIGHGSGDCLVDGLVY